MAKPILKQGITFEELQKAPQRMVNPNDIPFSTGKFQTLSGKFEFIHVFEPGNNSVQGYPLRLLSTMPDDFVGSVPPGYSTAGAPEVQVHPDILTDIDLADGDPAIIESSAGNLTVRIKRNFDIQKDCVLVYKGGWLKHDQCVNVLTQDIISEVGDGTPYYDTWVKIIPVK
nr:molybdopterin dinucleotide binding domain-containing protein [Methanobacterium formicicum]